MAQIVTDAVVIEVLQGLGLAHLNAADGFVLGLTRQTHGALFDQLQVGQWYRCVVEQPFCRVRTCSPLDRSSDAC
jgi:hypothetical protein